MNKERPTSINVVSYFFIVTGTLSTLSGIGYIVATFSNGFTLINSMPAIVQVSIASSLIVAGAGLLKGSERMRNYLKIISYLIIVVFIIMGVKLSIDYNSLAPAFGFILYSVPILLVIRALSSTKLKSYTS